MYITGKKGDGGNLRKCGWSETVGCMVIRLAFAVAFRRFQSVLYALVCRLHIGFGYSVLPVTRAETANGNHVPDTVTSNQPIMRA